MQDAILAGIFNDLGSGSNVDITIIKKVNGRVEVVKDINSIKPNEVSDLRNQIMRDIVTHIPRGATRTLSVAMLLSTLTVGAVPNKTNDASCSCVILRCVELQV